MSKSSPSKADLECGTALITAHGAGLTPAGSLTITQILPAGPNITLDRKKAHLHKATLTATSTFLLLVNRSSGELLIRRIEHDGKISDVTDPGRSASGSA